MHIKLYSVLLTSACLLFTSCSTFRAEKDAVTHFARLLDAGTLPGFARDDHGHLRTEALPIHGDTSYPRSVKIYATRENDPAKYTYTFTKDSSPSEWRLTAAWRTRPDGQREDLKIE